MRISEFQLARLDLNSSLKLQLKIERMQACSNNAKENSRRRAATKSIGVSR